MKHSILCVDDEADNVDALERLFRRDYHILKATTGREALELLAEHPVAVIISDQRMPRMSGVEVLAKSIKVPPAATRILLTGYTDIESVIAAINAGHVYRYVTKPWDPVDLTTAVSNAIERHVMGEQLKARNLELQAALDSLRTLDAAKSDFMILINHELKTPLTSILSFGDLLSETKLSDDQKLFIDRIRSSSLRLQRLVDDSLKIVSAETGQLRIVMRPAEAKPIIVAAAEALETAFKARDLEVKLDLKGRVLVHADERLIGEVLHRLLENAAKFAEPGSRVLVEGGITGADKDRYQVRIVNASPPINPTKVTRLLEPFTMNENILNHSSGTGLGLSVAGALLRAHESKLQFECYGNQVEVSFDLKLAQSSVR